MKHATYTGEMLTADFKENTITFEIEGDFKVRAGKYFIFSENDLQNFVYAICEKQIKMCVETIEEHYQAEWDNLGITDLPLEQMPINFETIKINEL